MIDRLIAGFMVVEPPVDAVDIGRLSKPARAELRALTADYYGCAERYRSALRRNADGDEALHELLCEEAEEALASFELNMNPRPSKGFRQLLKDIQTTLEGASRTLHDHRARWLLKQLDIVPSVALAVMLNAGKEGPLIAALEIAIRESDVIDLLEAEVRGAEDLSSYPRRQVLDGLLHLRSREYVESCPQLLNGLEGTLRDAAFEAGELNEVGRTGRGRPAIADVVKLLSLSDDYTMFVRAYTVGDDGNEFRHCAARHGARRQALICLVALAGWYAESDRSAPMEELKAAIRLAMSDRRVSMAA